MTDIATVTDDTFDDLVLKSSGFVLVDFWATWCGPCKLIGAMLPDVKSEYPNIQIYKLDTDQNPNTTIKLGIRGVPTLLLYHNGVYKASKVGAVTKNALLSWIKYSTE
jgi:thioredoxin 1